MFLKLLAKNTYSRKMQMPYLKFILQCYYHTLKMNENFNIPPVLLNFGQNSMFRISLILSLNSGSYILQLLIYKEF